MVASKVTDMDQTRVSGAASDRDRMGVPVRTPRLLLRRPTMADAAFHHALHSDPALYEHSPSAREVDATANAEVLRRWIEHWEREGFGYWIAERVPLGRAGSIAEPSIGPPVGFVGVRRDADVLNLYYRFSPPGSRPLATDGDPEESRGLGREAARAAVAWATQWLPDERVQAVCKQTNARAIATAHAAGLLPAGRLDAGDGSMFGRWVSPRFEVTSGGEVTSGAGGSTVAAFTDGEVDEMLDLWERVVRAEGSVGFRQDAPRPEISDRLRQQLDATLTGAQILVRMRDPADRLLGFAWWVRGPRPMFAHVLELSRLMVDPTQHGRHLGSILLARLHAVARAEPDVRLLHAEYRAGAGLGRFYAANGYVEVGRYPGFIQPEEGVFVDSVSVLRRCDGEPLPGGPFPVRGVQ